MGYTKVEKEDQTRNGVKVIVHRFYDRKGLSGTTVEADCQCFGGNRTHSNPNCPRLKDVRS